MNERDDDSRENPQEEERRESRQPAADKSEKPEGEAAPSAAPAVGGEAGPPDPAGGPEDKGGADDGEDGEAASPSAAGASAFKDSGSFFRDQVARTLAEQGFNLREDGTWGPSDSPKTVPDAQAGTGSGASDKPPAAARPADEDRPADAEAAGAATPAAGAGEGPAAASEQTEEPAKADDSRPGGPAAADRRASASAESSGDPTAPSPAASPAGEESAPTETPQAGSARTDAGDAPPTEVETGARPRTDAGAASAAAVGAFDGTAKQDEPADPADEDGAASAETLADEPRSWFTPRVSSRPESADKADAADQPSPESAADPDQTIPSPPSARSAGADSAPASDTQATPAEHSAVPGPAPSDDAPRSQTPDQPSPTAGSPAAAAPTPPAAPASPALAESAAPVDGQARESGEDASVRGDEPGSSERTSPYRTPDAPAGADRAAATGTPGRSAAGAGAAAAASAEPPESPEPKTPSAPAETGSGAETRRRPGWHPPETRASGASGASGAVAASSAAAAGGAAAGTPPPAAGPPSAHGSGASGASGPAGPPGSSGPAGPTRPPGRGGGPTPPGGGKPKPNKPLWWRATRASLIALAACAVLMLGGFGIAYAVIEVPDVAKEEATNQGSTFYYADGKTQFAERGVDREPVDYEQIPEQVQEAVISAEDRGYWDSPGVSITGTFRAVWFTVTGQQVQGGSTITQQFVRNYFEGVSREQTVTRKLKEIIIALKVDQSPDMDKQWVMEQYLNTIYFGRNAYGIQSAAQAYYHKDVGELTAAESAFLAAAIQQPSIYGQADSHTTPEMEGRWQYVVDGMVETGAITQAEADKMEFPEPKKHRPANSVDLSGYKGYMLQQAMKELKDLGYSEDNINRGGYKVVTTFDQQTMEMAKRAVEDTVDVGSLPEGVQAGLTAVDPNTGEVVGFYGGENYLENQYDSAFNGSAQAGSAFKPYVLATALEQGYSLHSTVNGNSPIQVNGATINNYDHTSHGPTTLVEATRMSLNTGYVQLAQEVGPENVRKTAYEAGIPKRMIKDNQVVPAIALGVTNVRPVDQATGFATFANGGKHVETHVIREIVNKEGENERPEPKTTQALSSETAANVSYALQQVVQGGTGTSAALPDGRPVAGKTGTTDGSVAAWFAGYTPQLATAVGVYNGNNQPFSVPGWGQLSGGTLPAAIWDNFMTQAMQGKEVKQFPEPSFGGEVHDLAPDPPPAPEQTEPVQPSTPPVRPEEPTTPAPPPPPETSAPTDPPVPPPGPEETASSEPGPIFPEDPEGGQEEQAQAGM
ncbi:penicillin-binding protein [Streptomonospora sp. PA3]|nr:penicillin-binding protein [Streptomonospora sp. PA3]